MEKIIEQAICLTTGCDATKFAEANETAYKIAERVAELADVRYKDALAKGREILNNDCSSESTKECCREIFPELKESEDERIRISIVETIKQCPDTFLNSKNRDRMLAYLERQKEQKPHWKPSEKQMEELEYGIGLLGNMNVANALRELYSDLKKL